jgi:hypothetical protein
MQNRWKPWPTAIAALIALGVSAQADVKKFMKICDGKICPFFELVATPPDGWILEKEATKQNNAQMFAPKGKTFRDAEALIYVKVSVRQNEQPLDDFVKVSQDRWRQSKPDTKITKMPEVARANGKGAFQPYQYENPSTRGQPFEYVAFGEDDDSDGNKFFIMVAITGGDRKAIEKAGAPYRAFLGAH